METLATAIDILTIVFLALVIVGGLWAGVHTDINPPGINGDNLTGPG